MDSSHNESIDKIYKSNGNSFQEQNSKCGHLRIPLTSLVAQTVKSLSTMRVTRVRSLGRQDPLEKEMAIHSSILAWRNPWTEEPGGLESIGSHRVRHDWRDLAQQMPVIRSDNNLKQKDLGRVLWNSSHITYCPGKIICHAPFKTLKSTSIQMINDTVVPILIH